MGLFWKLKLLFIFILQQRCQKHAILGLIDISAVEREAANYRNIYEDKCLTQIPFRGIRVLRLSIHRENVAKCGPCRFTIQAIAWNPNQWNTPRQNAIWTQVIANSWRTTANLQSETLPYTDILSTFPFGKNKQTNKLEYDIIRTNCALMETCLTYYAQGVPVFPFLRLLLKRVNIFATFL